MKELVETLRKSGALFKRLAPLELKPLGVRKRMDAYEGVDEKGMYAAVFHVEKKSRILVKEAGEYRQILETVESARGHKIKRPFLVTSAPLCSKAKAYLEEHGWKVVA